MKKIIILLAAAFVFSINVFGQVTVDYSGTWIFDKVISHPDDKLQTATIKMIVTQTPSEIRIVGNWQGTLIYPIGKEATIEVEGSGGKVPAKLKAELTNKGKLVLNLQQNVKTNNEDITVKIKETFELSSSGNTLTGSREIQNSKGLPIIEAFVATKQLVENSQNNINTPVYDAKDLKNQFSQAILNGKAKKLEIPAYPGAASASRVTGIVPVRVIFDESGKVVYAQAIFGHLSLKNSAVESAMKSTFEPVAVNGKLIKISGIIVYDFRR
ncbi:MAG TPA: energy transducer TonB [Pyrinomonadaceae bacterium]